MEQEKKKVIYSGMQPSGHLSLGNYLGALKNWVQMQNDYNCLFCIVDMHSITVRQDPATLRKNARDVLMLYLAAGINPEKNIIYYQSHVPAHAELAWILNCYTYMGELSRMTQFKEKSQKHESNINSGLFTYPVLMAADILLYQTDLVPVGEDQRQHLELCRDIAIRFNRIYGSVFTIPEPYIGETGARIMDLQYPERKMSKSATENPNSTIFLLEDPKAAANKIKRAVTDSGSDVVYAPDKPGISNLFNIYCAVTGKTVQEVEREFADSGYGKFKQAVGDVVAEELFALQERLKTFSTDKEYIDSIIAKNAEKANRIASRTLQKVKKKVGFPVQV